MLKRTITIAAVTLLLSQVSNAQSLFDYFSGFGQPSQESVKAEKAIEFDYDIDFDYYTDIRDFQHSSDLFRSSININRARFSPAFGIKARQNGDITHRLLIGVNLTKELGANPTLISKYSDFEADESQLNSYLFKEIFYYYNLQARIGSGRFDLLAGLFPRNEMEGEYGRAIFSDDIIMSDPNIEGLMLKYRTPRFLAELGGDWSGSKGLDRYERYTLFTAGSYSFTDWLSAGWAASYMHVGGSMIFASDFHDALGNPYVKLDFGRKLGMQELSLKAGALASMQIDMNLESTLHIPLGGEATFRAEKWNVGVEDTFYYGDNLMPYKGNTYAEDSQLRKYADLIYIREPFYFTHRGFPSGYDRLELFYEPKVSDALSLKVSAVGHFIFPMTEAFGSFLGWQARASVIFNLDGLRKPAVPATRSNGRKNTRQTQQKPRQNGPAINL